MNRQSYQQHHDSRRDSIHKGCFGCGLENPNGLQLAFTCQDDGSIEATFDCESGFAGYPDSLHGGIICTLLDTAMTNCLFAHDVTAVTVDISVRFRHPVQLDEPATLRAQLTRQRGILHVLNATLTQNDQIKATATGRFFEKTT